MGSDQRKLVLVELCVHASKTKCTNEKLVYVGTVKKGARTIRNIIVSLFIEIVIQYGGSEHVA